MSDEHPKALAAEQKGEPSERQLRQRQIEQLIRYDRARMAARLNGARMAESPPTHNDEVNR